MTANLEKVRDLITSDLAQAMFQLLRNYPGYEAETVRLMTAQLGSLISVATKDPQQALVFYAQRLAQFDWETVRSDYFANTLGVDTTVRTDKPLCEVTHLDPRRNPVRADDSARTGSPAAQKPSED